MATIRSGGGGKVVTKRRKQRTASTPYYRPTQSESPNWFSSVVFPSARAIASGAGKILSSIFSESGSSSSEDEDYASEDDIVNDNFPEILCNQEITFNKIMKSSEMMQHRQESGLSVWRNQTKKIIEQLIMTETFSSEEYDRMIKVLNSRVIDWSFEAGEKNYVAGSPVNKLDHAVKEAKNWFQEKKAGLSSVMEFPQGSSNLNSITLEHVETGGCTPVDVGRSYMTIRSPWVSSWRDVDFKTPSTMSRKLSLEGMLYSDGQYYVLSSENQKSFASGSCYIPEELLKLRSNATKDMFCTPSTKSDPSNLTMGSARAGEEVFSMGERMTEPQSSSPHRPIDALLDAAVSTLGDIKSRQDSMASKAVSSLPDTSVSGNNESSMVPEVVQTLVHPLSPDNAEDPHSDLHFSKVNSSQAPEGTKIVVRESANRLSSSQVSLSRGVANHNKQMENPTSNDKPVNIMDAEGCKLLTEACMEVSIITETNSKATGYRNSLDVQYKERSLSIAQPSPMEKHGVVNGNQQRSRTIKYNRRGRGNR